MAIQLNTPTFKELLHMLSQSVIFWNLDALSNILQTDRERGD